LNFVPFPHPVLGERERLLQFTYSKGHTDIPVDRTYKKYLLGVTLGIVVARIAHHLTSEWEQLVTPRE